MKKILPIILLLGGLSTSVIAQPILTNANSGYQSGLEVNTYTSNFDTGAVGSSVVWDFSTFSATSPVVYKYEDNTDTDFPDANLSYTDDAATTSFKYKVDDNATTLYGFDQSGTKVIFSDPEEIIRYPFTIGDNYVDDFSGTLDAGGAILDRIGTISVTAVGYGTLITPFGTHAEVLKVKAIENYEDFYAGTSMYTVNTVTRRWYCPNYHSELAGHNIVSLSSTETALFMVFDSSTSIQEPIVQLEDLISFYPNPATDFINVVNKQNYTINRLYITDISGKNIMDCSLNADQSSINISQLAAGNYIIHVVTDNGIKAGELFTKK